MNFVPRTHDTANDHFTHLGEMVLRFFSPQAGDDPVYATVGRELGRIVAAGSRTLIDDMRRELDAVDDATRSLQRLAGSKFAPTGEALASAFAELERSRQSLSLALTTLEGWVEERSDENPPLADVPPLRLSGGSSSLRSSTHPKNAKNADIGLMPILPSEPELLEEPEAIAEEVNVSEPDEIDVSRRVAQLFAVAEELRRDDELAEAQSLYSELLELDPDFGPAYGRRGSVALQLGNDGQAVDDLTRALEFHPDDALILTLRGDAHTIKKRYDSAVADYTRALECRPGLFRPRFNRAVVLRLRGDLTEARSEFSLILDALPGHAASHFQRGLIDEQSGATESARAEFAAAVEHDPTLEEARRQRDALESRLEKPAAQPKTSPAPRLKPGRISIACPHCGEVGAVQLERLGQVFHCRKCQQWFGIQSGGTAVRLKKNSDGRWIDPSRPQASMDRPRRRWLPWAAAIMVMAVAVGGAVRATMRPREAAIVEAAPLPHDLPARAEMFGRAWLHSDVPQMRRLTTPTHDRILFSWFTHHKPPAVLAESPAESVEIRIQVVSTKPHFMVLRIRLARGASATELTQTWEERGEDWFFVPPAK